MYDDSLRPRPEEPAVPAFDLPIMGIPCWIDVMSTDVPRAREFYGEVFGWTSEEPDPEMGGYYNYSLNGVQVAGGMSAPPGMSDFWSVYLATDDIKRSTADAKARGAQVIVDSMPVMDLGVMGVITDPTGANIGMWQPGEHRGFGVVAEPGAPSWFELQTRGYDAALEFYRAVYGWQTQVAADAPGFRYTQVMNGDEPVSGVMDSAAFLPEGVPSHWRVYFGSSDVDATLATIVKLGGSIVAPAEDTPYGRLAVAADPNGGAFSLQSPNAQMPSLL
jgi:predicted enzyme related to lactoylglutathione lyase